MELYDFIENKLVEYGPEISKIESERKMSPISVSLLGNKYTPDTIYPEILEKIKDELLELECFKYTKKINIIKLPNYQIDLDTGEPISKEIGYLGEKRNIKTETTCTIFLGEDNIEGLYFPEVVDIYTIAKNPMKAYNAESVKNVPGVWIHPAYYDNAFNPTRKIEVVFNPKIMQDNFMMNNEEIKESLIKRFTDAVNSGLEVNIPEAKNILLRVSSRSVMQQETLLEIEKDSIK